MGETGQAIVPLALSRRYGLHASSSAKKFTYRSAKELVWPEKVDRLSHDCFYLERDDEQYLFIWDFGTVVFFNIPLQEHQPYLLKLGVSPQKLKAGQEDDDEDLAEDVFTLDVREGQTRVGFNGVIEVVRPLFSA